MARAKAGDRQAFERLFREHHVRVYNLAYYIVGDREEAEDITQRAFVKAWEELPRLHHVRAFAAWLNRIAANIAHDVVRARAARAEVSDDGHANSRNHYNGADVNSNLLAQERSAQVHRAISSLPEHQREVVVMHHLQNMSVQEIADGLGIAPGTVLSRLARGREALRRKLAPYLGQ